MAVVLKDMNMPKDCAYCHSVQRIRVFHGILINVPVLAVI